MITVQEVIQDTDMVAPEPFTIQRSVGQWVSGGFQNTPSQSFTVFGPVRNATDKEVSMLPEADRVGRIRAFYATMPILTTRGYAPVPSTQGEVLTAVTPGSVYTLSITPPIGGGSLYVNGLLLTPNTQYTLFGQTITLAVEAPVDAVLYFTWPVVVNTQAAESDIILYDGFSYRVMDVYRTSGSGYWKALGTRLETA